MAITDHYEVPRIPGVDARFQLLADAFHQYLLAAGRSEHTIKAYTTAVRLFGVFLVAQGFPQELKAIRRTHVEQFSISLHTTCKPATVADRRKDLHRFFAWALDEGEITQHPMAKMAKLTVPEDLVRIPTDDEIRRLLKTCEGTHTFMDRRDAAILRLFIDTGIRLAELTGLKTSDVDLTRREITVLGKGRRQRTLSISASTALALNRYLRSRQQRRGSQSNALWLGSGGSGHQTALGGNGVQYMLIRRCQQAGIARLHPHQLRHFHADACLRRGYSELDLMKNMGHRDWTMIKRYTAYRAADRARASARSLALGDLF